MWIFSRRIREKIHLRGSAMMTMVVYRHFDYCNICGMNYDYCFHLRGFDKDRVAGFGL